MSTPLSADPWAGITDEPTVRHITREERAREIALFLYDTTVNDTAEADRLAQRILNITYPELTTADQIDALPMNTVIINDRGTVYRRAAAPLRTNGDGITVGSGRPWEQPNVLGTKERSRLTSAQLEAYGPWTVVHQVRA